jgi:hypothetical protein
VRRHHTGSGRRAVIPADWDAAHRPVVEGSLRGRVALRVTGTRQVWTGTRNDLVPNEPYAADIPARIQALSGQARVIQLADDTEVIVDYLVVIPARYAPKSGHLVDVTDSGDPALDGRALRIEKAVTGTERFERDLFCTLDD